MLHLTDEAQSEYNLKELAMDKEAKNWITTETLNKRLKVMDLKCSNAEPSWLGSPTREGGVTHRTWSSLRTLILPPRGLLVPELVPKK